jgi:hypothetical protein
MVKVTQADRIAALIAAGDRLAGFAGHDDGCSSGGPYPFPEDRCTCGYTEAWKQWKEVRGE